MTLVGATYTVHGWLAVLIILVIVVIIVLGIRAMLRWVSRGTRRLFRRR